MLDQVKGLHIEPTNMCTLKCPRCSRTKFIEQFPKKWSNINLNLDHLKQFLDIDLSGKTITLCGNYGDPIYYENLFELITYFKINGSNISIATNGSYRSSQWWEQLVTVLDSDDQIVFGIDGVPENFNQYRINADWESIKNGINIVAKSSINTVWQYIPFSFNEDTIDQAEKISKELGIHKFLVLPSDRWDSEDDYLIPTNYNITNRSNRIVEWKTKFKRDNEILPQCKISNNQHYISANGFYTPCCFAGDHRFYYKTKFFKNRDLYDISKTTITGVLDHLKDFYSTLEDAKLNYCTFNCPKP